MYVIRLNSKGELGNSHPCAECVKWMHKLKIKRVFFSTGINNNNNITTNNTNNNNKMDNNNFINNDTNHHNCQGPCAGTGPYNKKNNNNINLTDIENNNIFPTYKWERETWKMIKISDLVLELRKGGNSAAYTTNSQKMLKNGKKSGFQRNVPT